MTLDELKALATVKDGSHLRFQPPYQQMSVTLEEANFLYALVRALKPRNVLELGTGLGLSGFFIATALKDNGVDDTPQGRKFGGSLITVEPNEECAIQARHLLKGLPANVLPAYGEGTPGFIYIDSHAGQRQRDIAAWLKSSRALILVHDAERRYPQLDEGVGVYLPTANGMWLGRAK